MTKAAFIIIGSEITAGRSVDTNSKYLADKFTESGFDCIAVIKVPDDIDLISDSIGFLADKAELIVITGGLGSTHDDLTRESIAKATGLELFEDDEIKKSMTEVAPPGADREMFLKQAMLPRGSEPIIIDKGTAPGIKLEHQGNTIIAVPGVPREMTKMIEMVLPQLKKQMAPDALRTEITLKMFGAGEPKIAGIIDPIMKANPELHYTILAGLEEIKLITFSTASTPGIYQKVKSVIDEFEAVLGNLVFSRDGESMAEIVGKFLRHKRMMLAVAESCTGGMISEMLTEIPGSSNYFKGGIVSYDNSIKENLLGVSHETLTVHGAVSAETALQMAKGVKELTASDISLSVTGIAGPAINGTDKPVGLVFFCLYDGKTGYVKKYQFSGDRERIRRISSQTGLNLIRLYLEGFLNE